jgi:hypothetical protein
MAQGLADQRQVAIPCHQMRGQGVLQNMWVALLDRQASALGNLLEVTKELRPAELPSFLAGE